MAIDEIGDLLFQTGYRAPISSLTIEHKGELVSALLDFNLMAKVKCCMDQFMEGLTSLDLLSSIRSQPTIWKPLFMSKNVSVLSVGMYVSKIINYNSSYMSAFFIRALKGSHASKSFFQKKCQT